MMATGMPVVSSRHCDIPNIVNHKKTGLLANERDTDDIVDQIHWLINNKEGWLPMLNTARDHIEKKFNIQIQVQKLFDIYRNL